MMRDDLKTYSTDELASKLLQKILDKEEMFQAVTKLDSEIKLITQELARRR